MKHAQRSISLSHLEGPEEYSDLRQSRVVRQQGFHDANDEREGEGMNNPPRVSVHGICQVLPDVDRHPDIGLPAINFSVVQCYARGAS